jgi:replicative DNA helicase
MSGVATGFEKLDKITSVGSLVIYYRGKTGDGKTAFVLSMAQYGN